MCKKLIFLFLLSCFIPVMAFAETGIYIDGQTGWANQGDLPSAANAGATSISNDDFISTVWVGDIGYNHDFDQYIGGSFEIDSGIFGKKTYNFTGSTTSTIKTPLLSFLFGVTPHIGKFDIILKAGLGKPYTQISNLDSAHANNTCSFEFQTGLAYNIIPHLAATTIYMHLLGDQSNTLSSIQPSLNAVLVGLRVMF